MAPRIRELVSRFTYDNKLRDAEEIRLRTYRYDKIAAAIGIEVKEFGPVLVIDRKDPEEQVKKFQYPFFFLKTNTLKSFFT